MWERAFRQAEREHMWDPRDRKSLRRARCLEGWRRVLRRVRIAIAAVGRSESERAVVYYSIERLLLLYVSSKFLFVFRSLVPKFCLQALLHVLGAAPPQQKAAPAPDRDCACGA